MNQARPSKKNTQTLPSLRQDCKHPIITNRRDTRTPELRSRTPRNRNMQKNKKTPLKQETDEQTKRHSTHQTINPRIQPYTSMSSKAQPTLCSTAHIKITDLQSCNQCPKYQSQIQDLTQQLDSQSRINKQLGDKYKELKQSYEKKVKKYKIKNNLLKDQLKLLKWILGQRKEFSEVLEQLQVYKDKKGLGKNQLRQEERNSMKINHTPTQIHTPRQSSELQQQVNILQQRVMELEIKNDFLERIKLKPQEQSILGRYSFSNAEQFHCLSYCNQVQNQGSKPNENHADIKRLPLHHTFTNNKDEHNANMYQYSDEEESLSREKDKENPQIFIRQNCWNAASKQLRPEVESRYMSPLKERMNENNFKQSSTKKMSSRKQNQTQEYVLAQIPESRSKYCDSIKERSRLLGL